MIRYTFCVLIGLVLCGWAHSAPLPDGKAITFEPYSYDNNFEDTIVKNEEKLNILDQKVDDIKRDMVLLQGTLETEMSKLNKLLEDLAATQAANNATMENANNASFSTPNLAVSHASTISAPAVVVPKSEVHTNESYSDEEAYKQAYKLIVSKDYEGALVAFTNFTKSYSESDYQPNAHYWLGELYLKDKDFKNANIHFGIVINKFPNTTKVASAMLKRAYGLIGLEKIADAKNQLILITQNYPNTSTALIAKKKLDRF